MLEIIDKVGQGLPSCLKRSQCSWVSFPWIDIKEKSFDTSQRCPLASPPQAMTALHTHVWPDCAWRAQCGHQCGPLCGHHNGQLAKVLESQHLYPKGIVFSDVEVYASVMWNSGLWRFAIHYINSSHHNDVFKSSEYFLLVSILRLIIEIFILNAIRVFPCILGSNTWVIYILIC